MQKETYSHEDIVSILKVELLGIIPEDDEFIKGLVDIPSEAEKAIRLIAKGVLGKMYKPYDYLKKYSGFLGSIRREIKKRI
jgi:septum formation inhibitor-activating ATPase MinD